MKQTIILISFVVLCLSAGVLGSIFTTQAIPDWYALLIKPTFSPPNWLFAPAWTTLYILMGIAMYVVYRGKRDYSKFALWFFGAHLIVNAGWSYAFFGLRNPTLAFAVIILLWVMIAYSIYLFGRLNRAAGWLLVPYLLWVSFASYLNYAIWMLNR